MLTLFLPLQSKAKEKSETEGQEGVQVEATKTQDEIETEEAKKIVETLTDAVATAKDEESAKDIVKAAALLVGSLSDTEFNISFNPDVYQDHVQHADPEVRTCALELGQSIQRVHDSVKVRELNYHPEVIGSNLFQG